MEEYGEIQGEESRNHTGGIDLLIEEFDPVTLEELSADPLMHRFDEKYLLPVSTYAWLLPELFDHYRILEVDGRRNYQYISTYLDTLSREMYRTHQNGKKDRYKIRFRKYVQSNIVYLEIKHKINTGKTYKTRIQRPKEEEILQPVTREFIARYSPFTPEDLFPSLQVSYTRITLADPAAREKFTFDYRLSFAAQGKSLSLPELGVLEVKHAGRKSHSGITSLLEKYRIFPVRFSKYCTGMVLLYPGIKYNRFKPLLLKINRIHHGAFTNVVTG